MAKSNLVIIQARDYGTVGLNRRTIISVEPMIDHKSHRVIRIRCIGKITYVVLEEPTAENLSKYLP